MQHLTSMWDLAAGDVEAILTLSIDLKARFLAGERPALLAGHVLAQVFEKPSLRTRASFDTAIGQLGGSSQFFSGTDAGLNGRESLADVARVLSGYSDIVVLRTYSQSLIEEFAANACCPVINALSDDRHPCQALTDLLTIQEELGGLEGRRLVFVGDGNNVAASLAVASALTGLHMTISTPAGYELDAGCLAELTDRVPGAEVTIEPDPRAAVAEADIVYTDVWASMGQESESAEREQVFAAYQVNANLMEAAPADCRFMHDLPARRGLEVTDEVIDGPQSIVFRQADNRLHLAKALLVWLLGRGEG